MSPLQDVSGLPAFSKITPDQIQPAIEQAIQRCKDNIDEVLKQPDFTWDNLVVAIDDVDDEMKKKISWLLDTICLTFQYILDDLDIL